MAVPAVEGCYPDPTPERGEGEREGERKVEIEREMETERATHTRTQKKKKRTSEPPKIKTQCIDGYSLNPNRALHLERRTNPKP